MYRVGSVSIRRGRYSPACLRGSTSSECVTLDGIACYHQGGVIGAPRKTHCKHGHEFTPENTAVRDGRRCCRKCEAAKAQRHYAKTHIKAVVTTPAAEYETDPAELWERCEGVTSRDVAKAQVERYVDIVIEDDRPIALSFISDQHIATRGPVQLKAMREDAELISATDGMYAVLGGDGPDNHIKHLAAMIAAGSKVSEQWALYDHYLGMFREILAVISGNHDDWTPDVAGVNKVSDLAKQRKIHYSPDEVILRLSLGDQPYRIGLRHQYRYNSSFNLTHACKQWIRMGEDDWDVGVICHHHDAAVEPFDHHSIQRWAARPGSYQLTSGYSRRYGFRQSKPTCPTFILYPVERRIQGFRDVWDCASYLTYLRDGWPATRMARPAA